VDGEPLDQNGNPEQYLHAADWKRTFVLLSQDIDLDEVALGAEAVKAGYIMKQNRGTNAHDDVPKYQDEQKALLKPLKDGKLGSMLKLCRKEKNVILNSRLIE
jgi:hypothetical protein